MIRHPGAAAGATPVAAALAYETCDVCWGAPALLLPEEGRWEGAAAAADGLELMAETDAALLFCVCLATGAITPAGGLAAGAAWVLG